MFPSRVERRKAEKRLRNHNILLVSYGVVSGATAVFIGYYLFV